MQARRLREALSLLKSVGYEHSGDILLVIAKLAEAELQMYGPLAGLNRLNEGRALLHRSRLNTLYVVATVRIQVLADFYKDGQRPICEQYAATGENQRDAQGVMELVEATSDAIRMLLTAGNRWSAVRVASACLHELLDNRRLTAGDLLAALSLLDRDIDDLEKSSDTLDETDTHLEALEATPSTALAH